MGEKKLSEGGSSKKYREHFEKNLSFSPKGFFLKMSNLRTKILILGEKDRFVSQYFSRGT